MDKISAAALSSDTVEDKNLFLIQRKENQEKPISCNTSIHMFHGMPVLAKMIPVGDLSDLSEAHEMMPILQNIFTEFGIPNVITSSEYDAVDLREGQKKPISCTTSVDSKENQEKPILCTTSVDIKENIYTEFGIGKVISSSEYDADNEMHLTQIQELEKDIPVDAETNTEMLYDKEEEPF